MNSHLLCKKVEVLSIKSVSDRIIVLYAAAARRLSGLLNSFEAQSPYFLMYYFLPLGFDTQTILQKFSYLTLFGFILTFLTMMISTARFRIINSLFGVVSSWRFSHKVDIVSTIHAIFAMQLIMQITGCIQIGAQTASTL